MPTEEPTTAARLGIRHGVGIGDWGDVRRTEPDQTRPDRPGPQARQVVAVSAATWTWAGMGRVSRLLALVLFAAVVVARLERRSPRTRE